MSPGLSSWITDNTIEISSTFSHILVSENDEYNPGLSINGTPVNHVSTSKSLGVLIDANPGGMQTLPEAVISRSWLKKIASGIADIKRFRQFVPPATLHILSTKPWFSRISTIAMFFRDVVAIKLVDKLKKTPKSCSASSNFLKLWRRCIAAVPKSLNGF